MGDTSTDEDALIRPTRKRSNSGSVLLDSPSVTRSRKDENRERGSPRVEIPVLLRKRSVNDIIRERNLNQRKGSEPAIFNDGGLSPLGTPRKRRSKSKFTSLFRRSSSACPPPNPEFDEILHLRQNYDVDKVVLLQSAIRSWRARNHFLITTKHPFSSRRGTYQALKALSENEDRYVKILTTISQSYAVPLRSKLVLVSIPKEALSTLFFNTDALLKYHTRAAIRFQKILASWPISYIGSFLTYHLDQLSFLYNDYLSNLRRAEEVVDQQFKNTLGKLFLRNKAREHAETGVPTLKKLLAYSTGYLIGYKSYCLDLLYALAPFHHLSVHRDVSKCAAMASSIKSSLEKSIYKQDMKVLCDRLSVKLSGCGDSASPVKDFRTGHPNRKFIREATITLRERKKVRLFLFSDLLLITKPKGKKFQLIEEVLLTEVTHSPLERISTYSIICYRIITPHKTYPMVERSTIGFAPILVDTVSIAKTRDLATKDRLHHEPSLSPFILKIIYYLDKSRIKEGLFRPSAKNFNNGLRLISDDCKYIHVTILSVI